MGITNIMKPYFKSILIACFIPLLLFSCNEKKEEKITYIAATDERIYHKSTCEFVTGIPDENRVYFETREGADSSSRRPCRTCEP